MFDFFGDIGSLIMTPLYYIISAVLLGWHKLFSLVLPEGSGWTWALSIVGLTLVIRAALIPLFVKQIKSSRNMALVQPRVKELQKKYGHDREKLAQETMALYRETGTNPFSSCLPILLQMPIFFALFRLLDRATHDEARGFLTVDQAKLFADSELLSVKISAAFTRAEGDVGVMIMAAILVLAMTATTFLTQRQLMAKNMPPDALTGPYAQQQKLLLYVLPVVFAVGGIAFPIGVILYWTTSNLWTMGQQFYVIRRNPAPGTPAFKAKEERDKAKRAKKGLPEPTSLEKVEAEVEERRPAVRQQPKRQSRSQRSGGAKPAGQQQPTAAASDGASAPAAKKATAAKKPPTKKAPTKSKSNAQRRSGKQSAKKKR
ncbi:membrane protein insertase YidC [Nocardioides speluncae]|uniref:membrane protein insertase YidC n=1 Tax=Nocardioides speluncae TaxID=2670337 RepID=UPI000D691FCC|nr:membrane protein insertase YidC [Nocardioides speluncae]